MSGIRTADATLIDDDGNPITVSLDGTTYRLAVTSESPRLQESIDQMNENLERIIELLEEMGDE